MGKCSTLLVVGAGAIGREVVTRAKAFGIEVSIFDPNITEQEIERLGASPVEGSRSALLAALPGFDAVSMHVPAIESTKGMCDSAFFEAMKPGASFVNTSRGAIVDEPALIAAVQTGKIRAGLDVYCDQPSEKDTPWETPVAELDGVYCSHHCGASTDQAQNAVAEEVVRMVRLYKSDRAIVHCVNGVA